MRLLVYSPFMTKPRVLAFAMAVASLVVACSSSSSSTTPTASTYSYSDKCAARCLALSCGGSCDAYSCTQGSCAGDCARLTDKLPLSCAQCLIEQTTAATSNVSQCSPYRIGQSTDPACRVACGTGSGVDGG
jgi:hypothetical protein